jgi:hypothetical protein
MNIICEMLVSGFFKLSSGHTAITGNIIPNIEKFIPKCKADIYIGGQKIQTIDLIGEDRFSGVDEEVRQGKRSVRTADNISELNSKNDKEVKLIIYEAEL